MKFLPVLLVLLAAAASAQVTTFKSAADGFQVSVPAANFKLVGTKTGTTADGFPFTEDQYAGDNPQGDYIVTVTTYDREVTKDRLVALANTYKGEIVTSRDDLDVDGQYAVLRLTKTPQGKMANWMTAKGSRFYQIIFGSDKTAEQINFDEVNAFVDSFKFVN